MKNKGTINKLKKMKRENGKVFKLVGINNLDMNPGDRNGSPDEFFSLRSDYNSTLVFIDDGFLSKLSKFFGSGKYLKLHRKDFAEFISKKEGLVCEKVFVYTAPPFQSGIPTREEERRKEGYDKFVKSLVKEGVVVREGRCQRLKIEGEFQYSQKGVDILLSMDLMKVPLKYKHIKRIILIASDSDFVPLIKDLQDEESLQIVLYTYFEKGRRAKFSTSNELIKSVYKYVKLTKEDFQNVSNNK